MATITRGQNDALVEEVKKTLDEYERHHAGATADVYRQNSGSIRVRIVDERFAGWSRGQRHDDAWKFLAERLSDDASQELSLLLLLSPAELRSTFMNLEFDDPIPSRL